jgi:endonuclease III
MVTQRKIVGQLVDRAGRTYAEEAGIRLANTPSTLYRLLVLSVLLSTRIKAEIAVAAAKELAKAGMNTPRAMDKATWQQRVDALGRAHYVRYDESTARHLGECAERVLEVYQGDLRRMGAATEGEPARLRSLLTEFPRIGPSGAEIFCREVQAVWPWLRPYFDKRALSGARKLHLPTDPPKLAELVKPDDQARLAAALVRVTLTH